MGFDAGELEVKKVAGARLREIDYRTLSRGRKIVHYLALVATEAIRHPWRVNFFHRGVEEVYSGLNILRERYVGHEEGESGVVDPSLVDVISAKEARSALSVLAGGAGGPGGILWDPLDEHVKRIIRELNEMDLSGVKSVGMNKEEISRAESFLTLACRASSLSWRIKVFVHVLFGACEGAGLRADLSNSWKKFLDSLGRGVSLGLVIALTSHILWGVNLSDAVTNITIIGAVVGLLVSGYEAARVLAGPEVSGWGAFKRFSVGIILSNAVGVILWFLPMGERLG